MEGRIAEQGNVGDTIPCCLAELEQAPSDDLGTLGKPTDQEHLVRTLGPSILEISVNSPTPSMMEFLYSNAPRRLISSSSAAPSEGGLLAS